MIKKIINRWRKKRVERESLFWERFSVPMCPAVFPRAVKAVVEDLLRGKTVKVKVNGEWVAFKLDESRMVQHEYCKKKVKCERSKNN